jgi:Protein of unknown function (DUF3302)
MSVVDIFAIVVLVVLIATVVAVFVVLGMLPGYIARKRGHPWVEAVSVGGWVTLIFGFVFSAIYTDRVEAAHVIRKVVLRQTAILNYVNPF